VDVVRHIAREEEHILEDGRHVTVKVLLANSRTSLPSMRILPWSTSYSRERRLMIVVLPDPV